ncbi:GNS1/SUR4 family-domain-containing protein [Melampsora americana]|nr:GNS1/SUR4 family-domain-containing protein [Melampsora americana]
MDPGSHPQNVTGFSSSSAVHAAASNSLLNFFQGVANHPYPQIPPGIPISQSLYEFTLHPMFPITAVIGYVTMIGWLNRQQDGKNRMKGDWWKATVVLHNVLLAAYSLWTFKGTATGTFQYFFRGYRSAGLNGILHTFCDTSMHLWDNTLSTYSYWFYLSKYWEIIDSLILIGKGRKASLLQEYHHAGAIMTVWSGSRYESPASWLFVVFNSLVHTIMYSYYAISALHLPFPAVLKRSLTKIQITQFIVGGSLGALTILISPPALGEISKFEWTPLSGSKGFERLGNAFDEKACLHTPGQKLTVLGGVGYLIPLTGLFVSFYVRSYQQKHKLASSTKESKTKVLKND